MHSAQGHPGAAGATGAADTPDAVAAVDAVDAAAVDAVDALGDFTATRRMIVISALAIGIGLVGAVLAKGLLWLIALSTNLFFFGRFSTAEVTPADAHLGWLIVAVPVLGGLLIGLMAWYGSERIRGHGIPEAIEAILINGSRVQPKVALLAWHFHLR